MRERPLSPHLQVYRPQSNSVMSFFHRATGVVLSAGALLIAWWLIAAASGEAAYRYVNGLLGSWFGTLLLFCWTLAFFYHLCNGVRHLLWDTGLGLENEQLLLSGKIASAITVFLTLAVWIFA